MDLNQENIIWVAGFFDGEGCVVIRKQSHRECRYGYRFELVVQIVNTYREVIYLIQKWFGGSICKRKMINTAKIKSTKPLYQWKTETLQAKKFLQLIYPYIKVKKTQVEIALKFTETIKFPYQRISAQLQYKRAKYKDRISDLNRLSKGLPTDIFI